MGGTARVKVRVAKRLHTKSLIRRAANCRADRQPSDSLVGRQLACQRQECLEPEERRPRRLQITSPHDHPELGHVARDPLEAYLRICTWRCQINIWRTATGEDGKLDSRRLVDNIRLVRDAQSSIERGRALEDLAQ